MSTVAPTEILWTVICLPGLFYGIKLFRRSLGDLNDLKERKINSIREYAAQATMITYFLIMFVQAGFVTAGLVAMITPPAIKHDPITALQVIITVTFMLVSFIISAGSFIIEKRRERLLKMISEIEGLGEVTHAATPNVAAH